MGRLEGRVAFVTGAASGIGFACARRFAEEGAAVVGADLNTTDEWAEVETLAPSAGFHTLDVTDEAAQQAAVAALLEVHGRVDILVTAAGVANGGPVHLLDLATWQHVQDVNLTGTFLSAKAVLPAMI